MDQRQQSVCRFPRQLTIYPGHSGYSSLQCGLPPPYDCAVLFDRQRFDDPTGGGTLSFARFSSAAVKTDDRSVKSRGHSASVEPSCVKGRLGRLAVAPAGRRRGAVSLGEHCRPSLG